MKILEFVSRHKRDWGVMAFLLVFMIVMAFRHPEFMNPADIESTLNIHLSILKQASMMAIVAAAMTLVIISGGIDLSVGSVLILTSCVAAGLMVKHAVVVPVAFVACVGLGLLCGAVNGVLSSWGRVTPFIVTLGMMSVARGLSYVYCKFAIGGTTIYGLPEGASFLSGRLQVTDTLFVPLPTIVMGVVFICMHVLLTRTRLGRYTYAIGSNEDVARLCGLPVDRVKITVFCICGGLCGLAGFIYLGELNSASAEGMVGFELDVIASVVIGGTSLMGGEGKVLGSLVGALLIAYIRDGLTREGAGTGWGMIVIGAIIVAAVAVDSIMKRRASDTAHE